MNPSEAFDELKRQYEQTLARVVADMFNEFTRITPVKTGQLKTSWDLTQQGEGWLLSNNLEYASVIFEGRRLVAGKMYGSTHLPAGLDPIIAKYNKILEREFERIKV